MAGKCETITNTASAEAGVEALAELGNILLEEEKNLSIFSYTVL